MNEDKLTGEGRDIAGKVKETAGDMTGNTSLQGDGIGDQLAGKAQKVLGAARERPWAAAALAGVLGIALINTLRGKR